MSILINALKRERRSEGSFVPSSAMSEPSEKNPFKGLWLFVVVVLVLLTIIIVLFCYHHRAGAEKNISVVAAPKLSEISEQFAQTPSSKMSIKPSGINHVASGESVEELTNRYHDALRYIDEHDYQHAMVLLNNDELIRVTQGQSAIALAKIYLMNSENIRAEEIVRNALRYYTLAQNDLNGLLGQILFNQGQYLEAIDVLRRKSPPMDEYMGYYALLARSYIKTNNPAAAENLFKQLVAKQSGNVSWWLGLALSYQEAGKYAHAAEAYRHSVKLNTDDPQIKLFIEKQLNLIGETQESNENGQAV